jgi:hypothetical protein
VRIASATVALQLLGTSDRCQHRPSDPCSQVRGYFDMNVCE